MIPHDAEDPETKRQELARFLLSKVDWDQKMRHCERLYEDGARCEIIPYWVLGSRHLLRSVVFEDGVQWVLKIPIPTDLPSEGKAVSNTGMMRHEYETHLCFQSVCPVRVPKVYGIDEGSTTPFQPPYNKYETPCIYMEHLKGLTAIDALAFRGERRLEIIRLLHKQMAHITAQMISVTCPAAGDFVGLDPVTGRIAIRPYQQLGGQRPFQTSKDFYEAKCSDLKENYGDFVEPDDGVGNSPSLLQMFLALHTALAPNESFCMVNDDFGFHHTLVDEDWNITAILDMDGVHAAPWSWALKSPRYSDLNVVPESEIPQWGMRRKNEIQEKKNYVCWLSEVQSALERLGNVTLVREIQRFTESGGRELILGLQAYKECKPKLNVAWKEKYISLRIKAGSRTVCPDMKLPSTVKWLH